MIWARINCCVHVGFILFLQILIHFGPNRMLCGMQVVFTGTEYSFGDLSIIAGGTIRRTNDLQQMGAFVCFKHKEGCMISGVQRALDSMKMFLFEALKGQHCDAKFSEVKPALLKSMGNYHTACHEALCFHQIASR